MDLKKLANQFVNERYENPDNRDALVHEVHIAMSMAVVAYTRWLSTEIGKAMPSPVNFQQRKQEV